MPLVVMEVEVKRKLVVRVPGDASRRVKHPSPIFYIVPLNYTYRHLTTTANLKEGMASSTV